MSGAYAFVNKPRPVWFHVLLALGLILTGYLIAGMQRP